MKKSVLGLLCIAAITSAAVAGTETYSGKEMKQVAPPPCPQWYADNEFNVESDHAFGGGIDLKYFFHRYFGVGIEGWAVDSRRSFEDVFVDLNNGVFSDTTRHESRAVGSVLGTLTLRYPIPCTRFSPYIFGGGGGIFGGGEKTSVVVSDGIIRTEQTGSETRAIGQVGGGMAVRMTPHIGWVSDFSWNFVDGPHNNFGMVRTGVNFAF